MADSATRPAARARFQIVNQDGTWWLVARMRAIAGERMAVYRGDERVIGYYSDNELGWWNATLWKMTLEQPATSGQRQRLVELLRSIYRGDWRGLAADFECSGADDWPGLEEAGSLTLRPGGGGAKVMRRFLALIAERYYRLMHEIIREHDPQALVLGDRYQSFYYPEVAWASARYVDATSTNLNAQWNDGAFLHSYLDSLHQLTGRPILTSEIYLSAADNRSGCPNTSGTYPVVATQLERASAAARTVRELAALPYVVGVDWFQYYDEPPQGRFDGENYNFGLVDLDDRPYAELTSALSDLDATAIHRAAAAPGRGVDSLVPPAPPDPFADPSVSRFLRDWDRKRGYVPASTDTPLADLYLCWNADGLYLAIYFLDIFERAFYHDGRAPDLDRAMWTVEMNGAARTVIRLGAGGETRVEGAALRVESAPGSDRKVSNVAAMFLPANAFGKRQLQAGDSLTLRSELQTHARVERVEWRRSLRLDSH